MNQGRVFYLEQDDNLSGKGIFRMHITKASADRIVFDVENVSFDALPPGGDAVHLLIGSRIGRRLAVLRHGMYRLERESAGNWTGGSIDKRAVACYRAMAGIPADQEPPAAR